MFIDQNSQNASRRSEDLHSVRSAMFIAQNSQNASRRSEERNVSRVLPVYLSSAPPNVDTEVFSPRSIKMPP